MTDLTEQIRRWDAGQLPIQMEALIEAARIYANPNMQAAGDKYLEWIGYMTQKGYITINKPMADYDPQHLIVAAALTPPGDDDGL